MSFAILGAVTGGLASFVVLRLMNSRWRHQPCAAWVGREMELRQPPIRQSLGLALIVLTPIALAIGAVVRGPSNPIPGWIIAFLIAFDTAVGLLIRAAGRRKVTLSPDGIELRGLAGKRLAWVDLDSVNPIILPDRNCLIFCDKNGQKVAVDSTLYSWEEFLEKAPDLAGVASVPVARAIARVEGV